MRPTVAVIDLKAIRSNVQSVVQKVKPARVMAVVKANAYGHGMPEVAKTALDAGADYLAVALVEEGIGLREAGILEPTLIFGGFFPDQAKLFVQYDLDATLYSVRNGEALAKAARLLGRRARVHVKIDTGMGRVGVPWEKAADFVAEVAAMDALELVGVYTHFATSDERDKTFANLQLERFRWVLKQIESRGISIPIKHAANSGAILDMPEAYFDMVRPGIMLYGYYPSFETTESVPLQPAMAFRSRVLFVKEVEKGTSVSYGRKFVAPRKTTIATIPVGYADGYNRLLTNQGEVLIAGKKYPVVGRVCMDQILVDLGPGSQVREGDDVLLFGKTPAGEVSVYDICRKLGTIPYEVTCWVSGRVPRIYVNGGADC